MTTANNSGNNSNGNTIFIGAGGGGGGGGNVTYVPNNNWYTVTIPITSVPQQISIQGIDFAVPVEEKKKKSEGCSCKKCKEFFEYAEPNQEDGTLICWACRHGY